jgi:hypothetical protein
VADASGASAGRPGLSPRVIACRLACYRPYEDVAAAHLQSLGIYHVEVQLPPAEVLTRNPGWGAAERTRLAAFGLSVTTAQASLDLTAQNPGAQVAAAAPIVRDLGCTLLFIALRPLALPHAVQFAGLRQAAEAAAAEGLKITLETHPDLAANADQMLRTLAAVDHPALRINFDTANISVYSTGLECLAELRRVVQSAASVHLKDTDGQPGARSFPALGRGVVDFAGVFDVLDAAGFRGPCTVEAPGTPGVITTRDDVLGRMGASAAYLRGLGVL